MKNGNLRERAYTIIKQKILSCEYPPGSFINENSLLGEVGASRTPIREAMTKLENENLVQIIPKKGILVCTISLSDINDIYQTRKLIEPFIIRTQGGNTDKNQLREYRSKYNEMINEKDFVELIRFDDEFHRLLISNSKNKYLIQLLGLVYDQNVRIRVLAGKHVRRLEDTYKEHLKILDFILEDKLERAAEAMVEHLENSQKAAFEYLYNDI